MTIQTNQNSEPTYVLKCFIGCKNTFFDRANLGPIRVAKKGYFCLFLGLVQSNVGNNVRFRPQKYTLPFNITRYYAKSEFDRK